VRHCDASWKVAGSIPDCFIGIFHWHNPSGRTKALGLNQPVTEMSTTNISCVVKAAGLWGLQTYPHHVPIVFKSRSLNLLETSGSVQGFNGTALLIYIYMCLCVYIYIYTTVCWYARPGSKQARKHVRKACDFSKIEMRAAINFLPPCKGRRLRKCTQFWQKYWFVSFLVGLKTYQHHVFYVLAWWKFYICSLRYQCGWARSMRHQQQDCVMQHSSVSAHCFCFCMCCC
jgi:hypothetical protein